MRPGLCSPGPNTVTSGTLGMMVGYRRALPFLAGIFAGFVIVMSACAAAATILLEALPAVEAPLRYVGAAYVLWLAWSTWSKRASFGDPATAAASGFPGGFVLQFLNPKLAVYGLAVYSTFLADLPGGVVGRALSVLALAGVSFAAVTTWALAGASIRWLLRTDRQRAIAAAVLALALVYTAVELAFATGGTT